MGSSYHKFTAAGPEDTAGLRSLANHAEAPGGTIRRRSGGLSGMGTAGNWSISMWLKLLWARAWGGRCGTI